MGDNGKMLCLKEALIKPEVSAKVLLKALDDCSCIAERLGLSKEAIENACILILSHKQDLPKNDEGKRYLQGDDEIREEISRLLFGIPLKNLRRREERILPENPVASAAFDKPIQEPQAQVSSKTTQTQTKHSDTEDKAQRFSVQRFDCPDENAFAGYVGNAESVKTVECQIDGALYRGDALRPILLRGPSGCGKTELGLRIAKRIGNPFYYVSGSMLKTGDDVDMLLAEAETGSIIFVDETQAVGDKAKARILTKQSKGEEGSGKEVTFIFATNLSGKLPDAFRNRCIELKLRDYTVDELMQISNQTAKSNGIELAEGVAKYISERCHGIARYAVNYTHDIIIENAADQRIVTLSHTKDFFMRRGIDSLGLSDEHRQYIRQLVRVGQASVHSLAVALGENDVAEVEKSIEPLLLKHGLITISSRGRCLTDTGAKYAESLSKEV